MSLTSITNLHNIQSHMPINLTHREGDEFIDLDRDFRVSKKRINFPVSRFLEQISRKNFHENTRTKNIKNSEKFLPPRRLLFFLLKTYTLFILLQKCSHENENPGKLLIILTEKRN